MSCAVECPSWFIVFASYGLDKDDHMTRSRGKRTKAQERRRQRIEAQKEARRAKERSMQGPLREHLRDRQ